jgi:signal transduction histidine kinase
MTNAIFQHVVIMQYTIAILLVIVSFQALRVFRNPAFWFVACGWLGNLLYLAATRTAPELLAPLARSSAVDPATVASFFDFLGNASFWYAAHKYGRRPSLFYMRRVPDFLFLPLLFLVFLASILTAHFLPQNRYRYYFLATLPVVLLDAFALSALALYFRELGQKISDAVSSKALLLFLSTLSYAAIQPLLLLAHETPKTHWGDVYPLAFSLGFVAKILILFGMVQVFISFATAAVDSIAEQKRLQQLMVTIDRVAHELGNPMGEIQSVVLELSEEKLPGIVSRNLKTLESASQRIAAILGSLRMDIDPTDARLAARQVDGSWNKVEVSQPQVTNVNALIEVAKNAVKRARAEKVTYSHQYSAGCCIDCVPSEFVQIVINLLRNAYDSFRSSNPQIQIRTAREQISKDGAPKGDEQVKVTIRDTGEGIPPENLAKIFEQGFSTRGTAGTGRGFGLSIVKDLVAKNGGNIAILSPPQQLTSKDRHGTEVVLSFPRVPCVYLGESK